ncbi:MAG: beta-ketoacyl-ACP synthase [Rhizobiaceae bacterium]|nr:beta-ketoacyl-ACP synthase [Rhizobiaceae bacterium]
MSRHLDHAGRPLVAVTGIGIVTSLGSGRAENWRRLIAGESGIHPITRFPTEGLSTRIGGTVDWLEPDGTGSQCVTRALAFTAANEAVAEARLEGGIGGPLFLAAPPVELEWPQRMALTGNGGIEPGRAYTSESLLKPVGSPRHDAIYDAIQFGTIGDDLADAFGVTGVPVTLSTACASGATAIQLGVEAIRRGESNRALVIGADGSMTAEALIRFALLSALTTHNDPPHKASKPFSKNRSGFVMAEGAAALVLETLESAEARGAVIHGLVLGCGDKADDFHRTRTSPDGGPAIAAIRNALADAGLDETGIDYVNAHGTSTPENDKMEHLALSTVFGPRIAEIPVSSNKSMIGHTLSAAGAVEAAFSLLSLQHGVLPPTINHDEPDPAIPLDVVPNVARKAAIRTVLSNSFGFGGQNTCLVLGRNPL